MQLRLVVPVVVVMVSVEAGWSHVCTLHHGGQVRCFGKNDNHAVTPSEDFYATEQPVLVDDIDDAVVAARVER